MLELYSNLTETAGADNENYTLNLLSAGSYGAGLTTGTKLFSACGASRKSVVLSFLDITAATGYTSPAIMSWLQRLKELCTTSILASHVIILVLYKYNATVTYNAFVDEYSDWLTAIHPGWNNAGNPATFLPFAILRNDDYNVATWPVKRLREKTNLPLSVSPVPFTYILSKNGAVMRVHDKLYPGCANNGKSEVGVIPGDVTPSATRIGFNNWTAGDADANENVCASYITKRLADIDDSTPTVLVSPDSHAVDGVAGTTKVRAGSKIRFTYSEKGIGTQTAGNYLLGGAAGFTTPLAGLVPDTDDLPTPGALQASQYLAGMSEAWEGTVAALTAGAKTFSLTGVVDGANTAFAIDASNTSPLQFEYDAAGDTATCEVSIKDGVAAAVTIGDLDIVPVFHDAARILTVRVVTGYPTPIQPTGRIILPDDSAHELTFVKYKATVNETVLSSDGVYTVVIDAFTNNAGNAMAQTVRRFMVATETSVQTASTVNAIEGWGYFSRDDGAPNTVVYPSTIAGDSGWTVEGSALPTGGTISAPFSISATAGSYRSYLRTYGTLFGSAGSFTEPGLANYYVEGCFRIVSHSGSPANFKDENGATLSLHAIGVGLEVWDGPYHATLCVVQPAAGSEQFAFMTASSLAAGDVRFRLTGLTVPTGSLQLVRLSFDPGTGDVTLFCGSVAAGADPTVPISFIDTVTIKRTRLACDNDTFLSAGLRFGVLPFANQIVTCEWEFVRYAFLDSTYKTRLGETNTLGFAHTQSADGASGYRSRDLLFGVDLDVDPEPGSSNTLTASIAGPATITAGTGIPYTIRFYSVDWDDVGGEGSPDGFAKANFPSCYRTTGTAVPGYAQLTTGAVARGRRTAVGAFSVTATWNFSLEQSRLARRLLVCAYADSPLFPTPVFIAGMPLSALLVDDAPAKTDFRFAVRQFFPDFYVRDYFGDEGLSKTGGSLSPDMAIGVFLGPNNASVAAGPHGLRTVGDVTQDPDPRIVEEGSVSYPSGFALGQPHASPTDMTPVNLAYAPTGGVPMRAVSEDGSVSSVTMLDSAWSDNANQCYYNRMWVRVSNRGIVPGPAVVQVFFLGSALRSAFDVSLARAGNYQKIFSNKGRTYYAQSTFQLYSALNAIPATVNAVPALSGASTRGVSPTKPQNFVLAEFVWHFGSLDVPGSSADSHGCRAACINMEKASPPPADPDPWSSGIDSIPIPAVGSIWDINKETNNISVRNSNVVIGEPVPPLPPVNPKCKVDDNGEPVDYRPLPNSFKMTFTKASTIDGLVVDASAFPAGETILRLDADFCVRARTTGMRELRSEAVPGKVHRHFLYVKDDVKTAGKYRYFIIEAGRKASIVLLGSMTEKPYLIPAPRLARLYFRIHEDAKPGSSKLVISQTEGGDVVGSYTTTVIVSSPKDIRFIADERTGIIYDVRDYPAARDAIPYGKRAEFTGPGLAVQEGFRFGPEKAVEFMTGKLKNDLVQVPKGHVFPKPPAEIEALPDGLAGGIAGQVVDQFGVGLEGVEVEIQDVVGGFDLGSFTTDAFGRYLAKIPAKGETIRLRGKKPKYMITIKAARLATSRKGRARDRVVKARKRFLSAPKDGCIAIKTVIRR